MKTIEHFIGGKNYGGKGSEKLPVFNPALGKIQAEVLLGSKQDLDVAVNAASEAFLKWSETPVSKRAKVMFTFRELVNKNIDEMAKIITREHGKVQSDARGEIERGLEVIEFACGIPNLLKGEYADTASSEIDIFSFREPLGVVAGITPFNFPTMVPMWMYPVAIACGNAFVLKPSERDPSASLFAADLFLEAGLPPGVLNVIHGDREIVDAILEHPGIAAVSFVGSTPVARHIQERATASGKRVQALGGAKNHAVVMPDADINYVSDHLVAAAFGSAGERCMAISVAVVVGDIYDKLNDAVAAKAANVNVGDGLNSRSEMGPVVTQAAKERIEKLIESGINQGAKPLMDGRGFMVRGYEDGFFVGPTLLSDVRPEMEVYREEIFGPVLCIVKVESLDAAIQLINSNPYGNGTAIFTSSGEAARRFQRGVQVGMVGVNVPIPVPLAHFSFGGWKNSLFGERNIYGHEGVQFYTRRKVVTSRWPMASDDSGASYSFPSNH